jgi:hypothetical protein
MTKVVKEEGLKKVVGWIIGGALDLVGNGAFGVWKYFNTKEMDNFVLFALVFFSIIGAMMIIGALIYWAYYVLSETAKIEYARIDAAIDAEKERINKEIADEKERIDAEKLRIDKLEKAVSLAYADKSWSDEQREANVFFVLRNNDLTTVNENLAKLEKRVKKLEPPQLTDEAIIRAYTN